MVSLIGGVAAEVDAARGIIQEAQGAAQAVPGTDLTIAARMIREFQQQPGMQLAQAVLPASFSAQEIDSALKVRNDLVDECKSWWVFNPLQTLWGLKNRSKTAIEAMHDQLVDALNKLASTRAAYDQLSQTAGKVIRHFLYKASALEADRNRRAGEVEQLTREKGELRDTNRTQTDELALLRPLRGRVEGLEREKNDLQLANQTLESGRRELQERLEKAIRDSQELERSLQLKTQESVALVERVEALERNREEREAGVEILSQKLGKLQHVEQEHATLTEQHEDLQARHGVVQKQLNAAQVNNAVLKQQRMMLVATLCMAVFASAFYSFSQHFMEQERV
jgi:hypothetical protein